MCIGTIAASAFRACLRLKAHDALAIPAGTRTVAPLQCSARGVIERLDHRHIPLAPRPLRPSAYPAHCSACIIESESAAIIAKPCPVLGVFRIGPCGMTRPAPCALPPCPPGHPGCMGARLPSVSCVSCNLLAQAQSPTPRASSLEPRATRRALCFRMLRPALAPRAARAPSSSPSTHLVNTSTSPPAPTPTPRHDSCHSTHTSPTLLTTVRSHSHPPTHTPSLTPTPSRTHATAAAARHHGPAMKHRRPSHHPERGPTGSRYHVTEHRHRQLGHARAPSPDLPQ